MSTKVVSSIVTSAGLVQSGTSVDSTANGQVLIRDAGALVFRPLTTSDVSGSGGAVSSVTDTDTIDLTLASGVLSGAVRTQLSLTSDSAGLKLVSDVSAPGNLYYYGTDAAGARGWHTLPPQISEGMWRYSNNTTMASPGSGYVRANNVSGPSVTELAVSDHTDPGRDLTPTLAAIAVGDTIGVQDQDNAAAWIRFLVTGAVTDNGTWFTIPVSCLSTSGAGLGNNNRIVLVFTSTGGGGGGSSITVTDTTTVDLTLTGGTALSAGVKDGSITITKLANMVVSPGFRGRQTSGAGVVEELSPAQAQALLPVFIAAGATHAKGGVPDPGATAHANYPLFLGDDAAWHPLYGQLIGVADVAADETTTSSTPVNLATTQAVSFTLDATANVLVLATATAYCSIVTTELRLTADVDGTDNLIAGVGVPVANNAACLIGAYKLSLAAGAHTITLQFGVIGGGTAHFRTRTLMVFRSP